MNTPLTEPCPNCDKEHPVGADTPERLQCDCGLHLQCMVPIFKMSKTGYEWRLNKGFVYKEGTHWLM